MRRANTLSREFGAMRHADLPVQNTTERCRHGRKWDHTGPTGHAGSRRDHSVARMMPSLVAKTSTLLLLLSLTAASAADQAQWDECTQSREPDLSIAACTKILQASDETPSNRAIGYYARAGAYKTKGDNHQAIADYTKAIEANPLYADAYAARGIVYQSRGDNDRAIADYAKAIEINPRYANAYVGRGMVYRLKGDSDHAVADLTKAIEINPSYAIAYFNRGSVFETRGERELAIADYS